MLRSPTWNKSNPRPDKRVGYESLYRDVLFYKEFYANDVPVILCEGKTDNIYLKCAIRSLAGKFPQLATKKAGKVSFKVRFVSYTETTARMLNLSGGTGDLNKFVSSYREEWKKFDAGHLHQPVIVLVDNDKGSEGLFKALKNSYKITVTGSEDFVHICENLYVVATPKTPSGKDTMIEDFFQKSVLQKLYKGKTFNPEKTTGSKTEYGKYIFAEQIVRTEQSTINFSRFGPILDRIQKAVADYAAKTP